MTDLILVYVTVPDRACAMSLAREVVDVGLAACANILPNMTSIYFWNGAVEEAEEIILLLRTRADLFDKLEEKIRAMHPYDVPCIVALPLSHGSKAYLEWINDSVKKDAR